VGDPQLVAANTCKGTHSSQQDGMLGFAVLMMPSATWALMLMRLQQQAIL